LSSTSTVHANLFNGASKFAACKHGLVCKFGTYCQLVFCEQGDVTVEVELRGNSSENYGQGKKISMPMRQLIQARQQGNSSLYMSTQEVRDTDLTCMALDAPLTHHCLDSVADMQPAEQCSAVEPSLLVCTFTDMLCVDDVPLGACRPLATCREGCQFADCCCGCCCSRWGWAVMATLCCWAPRCCSSQMWCRCSSR